MNRFQVILAGVFVGIGGQAAVAAIPLQINHQGKVAVSGVAFDGNGLLRFALVDPDSGNNLWTNDGTHVGATGTPTAAVTLPVVKGVYSVRLGDTALTNMTAIPSSIFNDDNVRLRIWFDDETNGVHQLYPDHPLSSSPYAIHAAAADTATTATRADFATTATHSLAPSYMSLFKVFGGDGSNGAIHVTANTNFSALTGGTDNWYLQATDFTVDPGVTLTVDTGWGFIAVKGTCAIHGTINADGQGEQGGAGSAPSIGYVGANAEGIGGGTKYGAGGVPAAVCDIMKMSDNQVAGSQLPVAFALSGSGGGAGSGPNFQGGCGGGAGGAGGGGGAGSGYPGENGSPISARKLKMLTGGGAAESLMYGYNQFLPFVVQFRGAGGGGAGSGMRGGNGGGVIYFECETLSFDGTLTVVGRKGDDGNTNCPGGGGGGGGVVLVRAKNMVANAGAVTVTGGIGGIGSGNGGSGGSGADGFKDIIQLK